MWQDSRDEVSRMIELLPGLKSLASAILALNVELGLFPCYSMGNGSLFSTVAKTPHVYDYSTDKYDSLNDGILAKAFGVKELRQIASHLITNKVVEIGAGTGIQMGYMDWRKISHYTAVDASEVMLQSLQAKIRQQCPEVTNKVDVLCGDATSLPFDADSVRS